MPENFNELDIIWYLDNKNINIYSNLERVTSKNKTDVIEVFSLVHKLLHYS